MSVNKITFKHNIVFICLILSFIPQCKKYPGDVPSNAMYLSDGYIMEEEVDGIKRTRYWDKNGMLESEKVETRDDVITRFYKNGKLNGEEKLSELLKEKEKKETIPKRPENIPKSSFKPEKLSYWASKVKSSSSDKDKIIWKLWDDDGKKKGYCVFTSKEFNGVCRVYTDQNTYLKHFFDNGISKPIPEIHTRKENLYKLSKEQQDQVKVIPESEPTLEKKWDQLGN
jgi:hypothetical protein